MNFRKFRHIANVLFVLILTPLLLFSCKQERTDSNLWEISGGGLHEKSYLFGSIHYIPKSTAQVRPMFNELLLSCNNAIFEADLDSVYNSSILPPEKYLTPKEYLEIKNLLKDTFKLDNNVIDSMLMKDAILFGQKLLILYFGETFSYDYYFFDLAKSNKLKLHFLESVEKLKKLQKTMVVGKTNTDTKKDSSAIKLWYATELSRREQIAKLKKYFIAYSYESILSIDSLHKKSKYTIEKNNEWVATIDSVVKIDKTFIVVGIGHLGGNNGLIGLLRKKGYHLKPI
jgi:uncharacterized protein YbaP (TraB family)